MFKNNKGFMLAEVVITSTIILTALVSLYVTFNKLYSNYNTRNSYYNIDGFYAIKGMINYLIDSGKLNEILNDQEKGYKDGKFYFIKDISFFFLNLSKRLRFNFYIIIYPHSIFCE